MTAKNAGRRYRKLHTHTRGLRVRRVHGRVRSKSDFAFSYSVHTRTSFFLPTLYLCKSDGLDIRVCIWHPIHRPIVTGYRVRMMNMNTNANYI